ncbi:hypothetical protein [Breoghania sp.]|uniref:hypothetical protein n=1 Tax=Breoghania sp. TaxID=2065378 RepID=UPI00260B73E9|nr:hypothetical protein [Breoghania sp.]MDJ0931179.1 hypothetical protein [Breoghania sp.]
MTGNLSLKAEEGVHLLDQLGIDVVPLPDLGSGSVTVRAEGRPADGLAVTLIADGLGASTSFDGSMSWPQNEGATIAPVYSGTLAFKSADVSPLGMLAGRLLPMMSGELPVDAKAKVEGAGASASLSDVSARLGDITLASKLDAVLKSGLRRVTGDVMVSRVALAPLSEVLLGADVWDSVGGTGAGETDTPWPTGAFGAPLMGQGTVSLNVTSGAVDVGLEQPVKQAHFALQIRADELAIDGL